MFQYHVENYLPKLQRSDIAVAIRADMLAKYGDSLVSEFQELSEMGLRFKFFHDVSMDGWDARALEALWKIGKIHGIEIVSVTNEGDFYRRVAECHSKKASEEEHKGIGNKLVFLEPGILERKNRVGSENLWGRVKLLTPDVPNESVDALLALKRNIQCRMNVALMREVVAEGKIDRIHLVPVERAHSLKNELFTLEGAGTLIESNFSPKIESATEKDVETIRRILQSHEKAGQLRPRSEAYIREYFARFLVARIDDIPVGCVEIIPYSKNTVEFGAIAVNQYFLDFRVGKTLLEAVEAMAREKGWDVFAVTNAQKKLIPLLESR